jgi:hypothetical protein
MSLNFITVKKIKTSIAVLSYAGYIKAKAKGPNVNYDLDTHRKYYLLTLKNK